MSEKKNTLMQRVDDRLALWATIYNMDGEVDQFIEKWLTDVETGLAHKVDNYKFILDELETESDRLDDEAKKLKAASDTVDRIATALKDRIKFVMDKMATDDLSGNLWRFKLANTKPALEIDEGKLPPQYLIEVISKEPDKDRIRSLLELGEKIPGCQLEPKKSLRSYVMKKGGR